MKTVALVGAKRGKLAELAEQVIVINDTHYGRVEDAQMTIYHMLCYAFMEDTAASARSLSRTVDRQSSGRGDPPPDVRTSARDQPRRSSTSTARFR